MEWKCRTVSLAKMLVSSGGIVRPLCDTCKSKDCSNPIENKSVSLIGVKEDMRVYVTRAGTSIVVNCEGYIP